MDATVTKYGRLQKPPAETDQAPSNIEQVLSENSFIEEIEVIPPISDLLKETRERKGLSQKCLAQKTGLTNVQLSRIESGRSSPTVKTLAKLAPYLGYPMEYLLLSASYSGSVAAKGPTYADLDGNAVDLTKEAQSMYQEDGELLLLVADFYKHYSKSDSELLKIILRNIKECHSFASLHNDAADKASGIDSAKNQFVELFTDLKNLIFSLDKMQYSAD